MEFVALCNLSIAAIISCVCAIDVRYAIYPYVYRQLQQCHMLRQTDALIGHFEDFAIVKNTHTKLLIIKNEARNITDITCP